MSSLHHPLSPCHHQPSSFAGAALAGVRGVRPNPSIFREGFSNPSIFWHFQLKLPIFLFTCLKLDNLSLLRRFGTRQFKIPAQPLLLNMIHQVVERNNIILNFYQFHPWKLNLIFCSYNEILSRSRWRQDGFIGNFEK